jgi:hypothetical protein
MWILPRQLHTSAFVPDTEALISDLAEQSQACAQSLLVRSKPSPARTWSLKWKRDSWTQLLSGRILKPSHGPSFTAAWTSSVAATHASHSAQPASDSAPKTHDTSGHLSQPELLQCDQVAVSLKTSRDISALGFPTCCKTWQDWVTERRGAWRQRVNAARLTRGKGSLSWPTISVNESKNSVGKSQEHRNSIPLGTMAAMQSWPTPNAQVSQDGESPETWLKRKEAMKAKGYNGNGCGTPLTIAVQLHGQADPASSNTSGSRQGLWSTPRSADARNPGLTNCKPGSMLHLGTQAARQELWLTPRANEPDSDPNFAARNADRGAHCHGTLSSQAKEMWPTITAHTPDMESNGPNGHQGTYLAGAVKQWATPRSGKTTDENPETWALRQAKGDVATMPLTAQVKCWGTPTARDHKSGRGNEDRQYKELTPMVERQQSGKLNPRWVETLMGLPIGWTMPSCTSPQTIAPMSCDSSAMELCQPPQSELSEFSLAS